MDSNEIRRMNQWLQSRIRLEADANGIAVRFDEPGAEDFLAQGFGEEAVRLTLKSAWWNEMITDIVETPEFAEPGESPEQVLKYARDLVVEYVGKRLGVGPRQTKAYKEDI